MIPLSGFEETGSIRTFNTLPLRSRLNSHLIGYLENEVDTQITTWSLSTNELESFIDTSNHILCAYMHTQVYNEVRKRLEEEYHKVVYVREEDKGEM